MLFDYKKDAFSQKNTNTKMKSNNTHDEVTLDDLPAVIHGSQDSLDKDIIYYVLRPKETPYTERQIALLDLFNNASPDFQRNQRILYNFCNANTDEENRNVILIDELYGFVTDCYKGTPDAINNQILFTFHLHEQQMSQCPIKSFAERNIVLKVVRSIRHLLGSIGQVCHHEKDNASPLKTVVRPMLKQCLKSLNFLERVKVLSQIDFVMIFAPMNVEQMNDFIYVSLLKAVAFQLVQTIAQFSYIEIYSKQTAIQFDEKCAPFIQRRWLQQHVSIEEAKEQLQLFNEYRDIIVEKCSGVTCKKIGKTTNVFTVGHSSDEQNSFFRQSNGHYIDMARERCIFFPIDTPFISKSAMIQAMNHYHSIINSVSSQNDNTVKVSQKLNNYLQNYSVVGAYQSENSGIQCHLINVGKINTENNKEATESIALNIIRSNHEMNKYDWLRFFHIFALDKDQNTIIPLLKRNQYSYHIEMSTEIDDIEATDFVDINSIDAIACLFHGRLFTLAV
jgi:hypothetical protein